MVPLTSIPDAYYLGLTGWMAAGGGLLIVALKLRRKWRGRPALMRWNSVFLSLWMLLFTLTWVEVGFALFVDQTDSFSKTNISQRWFQLHVRTNDDGFRDERPLTRPLTNGQKRLVFVGDSFAFGHGVEVDERFSDRIAARLEADAPGAAIVSNVALPGLDIRALVDGILPDVFRANSRTDVVVYTFVLNDIEYLDEATGDYYQALSEGEPKFFLFKDTYFVNWLYCRLRLLLKPEARDYFGYLKASYSGTPWRRLTQKLDELAAECRERDVELRLVVFPFLHNLGPQYPFAEAHEKLAQYCADRNIRCLDLRPALEAEAAKGTRLVVNATDAHPNVRCHELAAEAIREELLDDIAPARAKPDEAK